MVAINRKRRQSGSVTVETAEASCDSIVDNDAYDVCVNDLVETGDEAVSLKMYFFYKKDDFFKKFLG